LPVEGAMEDALADLEEAQEALEEIPPNNQAAVGNIEAAVGEIEKADIDFSMMSMHTSRIFVCKSGHLLFLLEIALIFP